MAIQPVRMPGVARGGQALAPRIPHVAVSGGGRVQPRDTTGAVRGSTIKPLSADQQATNNAMTAFRTALAQLQASTPPVDAAAIRAPYTASEAVTGQLGAGYQQAAQTAGNNASAQYTQGLNDAQKAAAAFGISAGANADAATLQNNGSQPIATQTLANTTAAAAAVPQWQNLLERAAANKVSDASIARQNSLVSGQQSLAANLPGAIMNEKTLANQESASRANNAYLRSSLTAKQQAQYDSNTLAQERIDSGTNTATANRNAANQRSQASINAANQRQSKSLAAADQRQSKALKAAQTKATAKGIQGISALNSGLKTTGTKGTKPVVGYKVTLVASPNGVNAGAPNQYLTVKDPKSFTPPAGWTIPTGTAPVAVYGQAGAGTSGTLSLSRWNQLFAQLRAANRGTGVSDAELRPLMPPRPKK